MNPQILLLLLISAMTSQGCTWFSRMDETRHVEYAQADDRECRDADYVWPSEAYRECRRFRFDARQRERWQELQMARQQQQPEVGIQPLSPTEPYRPVREENFRCVEAVSASGDPYIECSEDGGTN